MLRASVLNSALHEVKAREHVCPACRGEAPVSASSSDAAKEPCCTCRVSHRPLAQYFLEHGDLKFDITVEAFQICDVAGLMVSTTMRSNPRSSASSKTFVRR